MKIHEYQAKELLAAKGIPVPAQILAVTPEEAAEASRHFGGPCVVKAQVHAGGRGKAGGVKLVRTPEEAEMTAAGLIGNRLITHQSGPEGSYIPSVLVTECADIQKEFYLAITTDPETAGLVIIASAEGGTEIEELAKTAPEKIARIPVSLEQGMKAYQGYQAGTALGLAPGQKKQLVKILLAMYRLFLEKDCSLVEINPLILNGEGNLMALDAKVNFDDNALFRHPELNELRDVTQEDPLEARAKEAGFSYVKLDGSVGCLVNGAGLAMATLDIIKSYGGAPANFLDVGGSATAEKVTSAFELILSDPNVKAILVNIFGGIMKCDVIASGVVEAAKRTGLTLPLVVRLQGTNQQLGKEILKESGLAIIPAEDFGEAVKKAVDAAAGRIVP